jgi:four helix bundle protein
MGKIRTFRDLVAWQLGMALAKEVYRASGEMPPTEMFGLTSQMRRAAVSIPSNIAEGYARQSTQDYLKFLRIARGSLNELSTQLELAISLEMLRPETAIAKLIEESDRVLQGLIRSLTKPPPP